MKRNISALFVAVAFVVLVLGWTAAAPAADMGSEIQRACSTCHSTKRICLTLGSKDKAAWKTTVSRMVQAGAQLPMSKVDEAAAYLASQKRDTASFCR